MSLLVRYPFIFFFTSVFVLRVVHSLFSLDYHIAGDLSIPWMMVNDWEMTNQREYFWGQDYLRTYEIWVIQGLGKWVFRTEEIIPYWFVMLWAQILYATGVGLIYKCFVELDPQLWRTPSQYLLSLVILGFSVPAFQKYSFGISYSTVPLIVGATIYLGMRWNPTIDLRIVGLYGVLAGISSSIIRLNTFVVAGLILTALVLLICSSSEDRTKWILIILVILSGILLGLAPEMFYGLGRDTPVSLSLTPLDGKIQNLHRTLTELGTSLGVIPYAWVEGEHALWFHGKYSKPYLLHLHQYPEYFLKFLQVGSGIVVIWFLFLSRNILLVNKNLVLLGTLLVSFVVIILSEPSIDRLQARRYCYPLFFILSILLLMTRNFIFSRILISVRILGLCFYLIASTLYQSPLVSAANVMKVNGFEEKIDCLAGKGSDLAAFMSLNNVWSSVIEVRDVETSEWLARTNTGIRITPTNLGAGYSRLYPNFSKAIYEDHVQHIKKTCRAIYLIADRKETRLPSFDSPTVFYIYPDARKRIKPIQSICGSYELVYKEILPKNAKGYRKPLRIFRCLDM